MFAKTTLAAFASLLACAAAQYAEVYNGVGSTIYYELVDGSGVITSGAIASGTGNEINLGAQVSMKMDLDGSFTSPYQFEFNYETSSSLTYYDFSAVNGDPFVNYERSITPTDSSCQQVICAAGDSSDDCQFVTSTDGPVYSCPTTSSSGLVFNVVIGGSPI